MARARKIIAVSSLDAKLNAMKREDLLVLMRPLTTATAEGIARVPDDGLRNAARSYIRTGRLSAQAVLDYQPEVTT